MDVEAELQQLRHEVTAATEVSMVQASFTPPVSAVVVETVANGALFGAHGRVCLHTVFSGIDTLSPVVWTQVLAAVQAAALSGGADIASGGAPGGAPGGGPVLASVTSSAA
ncbi:hypothetical protein CYMTET_11825 [Cymbomonas tetramitiformis]|uniref:Uncharacterized protein n=1 Tax=Cymbomonas tetramitiformis TaxID=36881 RepID=A0AAE0GLH9_9CHLO|nr:hypothetical protein CYMTET_11825 [Cymbomonas tetramitiformis]